MLIITPFCWSSLIFSQEFFPNTFASVQIFCNFIPSSILQHFYWRLFSALRKRTKILWFSSSFRLICCGFLFKIAHSFLYTNTDTHTLAGKWKRKHKNFQLAKRLWRRYVYAAISNTLVREFGLGLNLNSVIPTHHSKCRWIQSCRCHCRCRCLSCCCCCCCCRFAALCAAITSQRWAYTIFSTTTTRANIIQQLNKLNTWRRQRCAEARFVGAFCAAANRQVWWIRRWAPHQKSSSALRMPFQQEIKEKENIKKQQ